MYAYKTKAKPSKQVDFIDELPAYPADHKWAGKTDTGEQIHYWRKHPNLHGWMKNLYREKGGKDEEFNCNPVVLTLEDLDRLERAVRLDDLPFTQGFFFGGSEGTPEENDDDLAFIAKAREAIGEGYTVYYDSWW